VGESNEVGAQGTRTGRCWQHASLEPRTHRANEIPSMRAASTALTPRSRSAKRPRTA
jgi:hypothetical protein